MSYLVKSFRSVVRTPVARRCFSDIFNERERAAEAAYFNQQDAIQLAALQAKLRAAAKNKPADTNVKTALTSELDQLRDIMAPHNLPEETLHGEYE